MGEIKESFKYYRDNSNNNFQKAVQRIYLDCAFSAYQNVVAKECQVLYF